MEPELEAGGVYQPTYSLGRPELRLQQIVAAPADIVQVVVDHQPEDRDHDQEEG